MSDFERVQIDAQQFASLGQKLDTLAARIGPADANYSLHQALTHIETTLFAGLDKIAKASGGGDNSQVLKTRSAQSSKSSKSHQSRAAIPQPAATRAARLSNEQVSRAAQNLRSLC